MLTITKIEKNFVTGNKPVDPGCPECPEPEGMQARFASLDVEPEVEIEEAPTSKKATK